LSVAFNSIPQLAAAALERDVNAMRFRAKYVSASQSGDYYQVTLENTDPAGDAADVYGSDTPYLLIQRQFEDPDGGLCYVETHDEGYIGHFRLRSIEFSPSRLLLEVARDRNNRIEVLFDIGQSEFEEVQHVIDIISGKSSPDDGHAP
jgi:hypothetical protein